MKDRVKGSSPESYAAMLRQAAKEIHAAEHAGWGNCCEWGAQEIERLTAENRELREQLTHALNHRDELATKLVNRTSTRQDFPKPCTHPNAYTANEMSGRMQCPDCGESSD